MAGGGHGRIRVTRAQTCHNWSSRQDNLASWLPGAWLLSMLLAGLQRGGRRQVRTKDLTSRGRTPVMKSRSPCRVLIGDGILGDLGLGHTPGLPRLVREFYQEGLGHRVRILILGKVFVGNHLRAADCNETPEHAFARQMHDLILQGTPCAPKLPRLASIQNARDPWFLHNQTAWQIHDRHVTGNAAWLNFAR